VIDDSTTHDSLEGLLAAEPSWERTVARLSERPMRFIGRRYRDDHVRKHVLEARNEKWHQVIDPTLLDRARSDEQDDAAFEELARAYVQVLDDAFQSAVNPPLRAIRLVRFEVLPPDRSGRVIGGFRPVHRSVLAWCPRRRLRIVAGIPVSDPGAPTYRLLSGYRSDIQGSARRFDRAVLRRLADRAERSQERLLDPLPDADTLSVASGAHG
jgi:hypothetical protein